MSEAVLRLGVPVQDLIELWGTHAEQITEVPTRGGRSSSPLSPDEETWSTSTYTGRIQFSPQAENSSLVRISIEAARQDEAADILDSLIHRMSELLPGRRRIDPPAIALEPQPDAAPGDETSAEQPL